MIADCHARGVDYVVDNTDPAQADRARYISEAKAAGYRVIGYHRLYRNYPLRVRLKLTTAVRTCFVLVISKFILEKKW